MYFMYFRRPLVVYRSPSITAPYAENTRYYILLRTDSATALCESIRNLFRLNEHNTDAQAGMRAKSITIHMRSFASSHAATASR